MKVVYRSVALGALAVCAALLTINATPAISAQEWSLQIFGRLAGRPPTEQELAKMVSLMNAGQLNAAIESATQIPDFVNLTARNFCQPMSTRDERADGDMNDFTATCMGIIRDDRPATEFLTGNATYNFDPAKSQWNPSNIDWFARTAHYQSVEGQDVNGFDYSSNLQRDDAQKVPKLPADRYDAGPNTATVLNPDTAGLLTTTTFIKEHGEGGTNRRLVEYSFREFLCRPISDFADATATDQWIGRDVDRAPGGNAQVYQTTCRACHSQLDGFRGAFAYTGWGFRGQLVTRPPAAINYELQDKYAINTEIFPQGHVTRDDSWSNNATTGSNADYFGWRGATSGRGIHEFGQMLASSKAFSRCMVQRAIQTVCLRPASFDDQQAIILPEADKLEADGYNLRRLFQRVAANAQCINPQQGN